MQSTSEKTVAQIAIENPASVPVFEALGIDYCCGGKRPLADACSCAHVDLDRAMALLDEAGRDAQTPDTTGWSREPLRALIDHIVGNHHGFVRQETPRIASLLAKVASKHAPAHPEILEIAPLFTAIGQELAAHMHKEEQVLFPHIARMEQAVLSGAPQPPAFFGSVQRPIAAMLADHDDAGALLSRIRNLAGGYAAPADACPTFVALYRGLEDFERDLHRHIHLENNILFPRAVEMEQAH